MSFLAPWLAADADLEAACECDACLEDAATPPADHPRRCRCYLCKLEQAIEACWADAGDFA